MASKDNDKTTLYHHTTKENAAKILQTGYIKQSTDTKKDAAYGPGTYLTSYGPDKSSSEVARNNYDGYSSYWEGKKDEGRTDAIIAVKIPKENVQKAESDRDIYVHKGDVKLEGNNHSLYVRNKDGKATEYKRK